MHLSVKNVKDIFILLKANDVHTYANQEFHDISTAQNDSQVYEPVKERTPQAPSLYTFLDSSTQQRVFLNDNCSKAVLFTMSSYHTL